MNDLMCYLSRATGIVATVLVVAALIWGFLFSARATGNRRRPNWWLDLHNWLGGLALALTGVHIVTALLDTTAGIGLLETIVPGTGSTALAWGVLATYLIAAAVFTTWPRRFATGRHGGSSTWDRWSAPVSPCCTATSWAPMPAPRSSSWGWSPWWPRGPMRWACAPSAPWPGSSTGLLRFSARSQVASSRLRGGGGLLVT